MSKRLLVRNRQRVEPVDSRRLQTILRVLLVQFLGADSFELAVYLVGAAEMTRLNQTYLRHQGSTDVLAFDYADAPGQPLRGEIFLCVDEAKVQARRFRTTWQSELVRYLVHGILHLRGHDDHHPARRRTMKRQETRLLKALARCQDISRIARRRAGGGALARPGPGKSARAS